MCIALCERERWGERGREGEREREREREGVGRKLFFAPNNNFTIISVYFQPPKRGHLHIKNRNCCPPGVLYINRGSTVYCIYK